MTEWIVKIIAASLFLTICSYILPAGNIKKTAMVLFGFVFITVLLIPVGKISENNIFEKARHIFTGKYKVETVQGEGGEMIISEYKRQIETVVTEYINKDGTLFCEKSTVYVNSDIESPDFGKIETIYCYVSRRADDDSLIKEDQEAISQIIIDINGIHSTTKEEESEDLSYKEKARDLVAEYLMIDREKVHIMDIKE